MKVVLLEKVKSVGNVGEIVNVSAGHARNFLIPNGFAVAADEGSEKSMAQHQKMLKKKIEEEKSAAAAVQGKLDGIVVEFVKKVGLNGKLFGSITSTELAAELATKGFEVERRQLTLETPIKGIGSFNVKAHLFEGVDANFQVKVAMDPAQAEELKAKQLAAQKKAEKKKAEAAEASAEGSEELAQTEEGAMNEEVNKVLRS
jgi:large subunit ribosomal protein L9